MKLPRINAPTNVYYFSWNRIRQQHIPVKKLKDHFLHTLAHWWYGASPIYFFIARWSKLCQPFLLPRTIPDTQLRVDLRAMGNVLFKQTRVDLRATGIVLFKQTRAVLRAIENVLSFNKQAMENVLFKQTTVDPESYGKCIQFYQTKVDLKAMENILSLNKQRLTWGPWKMYSV